MDTLYLEFTPLANVNDYSLCLTYIVFGCLDENACNFDILVTNNDGTCEYTEDYYDCDGNCISDIDSDGVCDELEIVGCTDNTACNYDVNATDDGTCEYAEDYYDCDGDCLYDTDGDGVCDELEIVGCTDSAADNYDVSATDEGTCEYPALSLDSVPSIICNGDFGINYLDRRKS